MKQRQQQKQQQKQDRQPNKITSKKGDSTRVGVPDVSGVSTISVSGNLPNGATGFSSSGIAKPPPGFSLEPPPKKGNDGCSSSGGGGSGTGKQSPPIPQIPPSILSALRSLSVDHGNGNEGGDSDDVRSHLSLVVLGHVDAGKSTLTGRLLLSLNHVTRRQYQKHQKSSAQIGKSSFALAWFADEDDTERERGVTIDVATKRVRTRRYDFTVLDAPGHSDFVPNMISGTACADCGLLVVAATTGEFEAGFADGGSDADGGGVGRSYGQTREHVVLSRGLGVTQFVVAVNKLDAADPPWCRDRFEYIRATVLSFLMDSGYRERNVTFVPVSGLTGVNVNREEEDGDQRGEGEGGGGWRELRKWYDGPTLVEALDSFSPAKREFEKPLRLILTDVSAEGKNASVRGRVEHGFVRTGDTVVVLPVGDEAIVARVERGKAANEGTSPYAFTTPASALIASPLHLAPGRSVDDIPELQNCALAGDIVEIELGAIDPARLSPGCVLCHTHPSLRPRVRGKFEARILVMERLAVPIIRGSQVLLHMHSIDVPAVVSRLISTERRGDANPRMNPRVLVGGATATVEITLSEKVVIEESIQCKALGRFVLRRGGDTIAVGLIDKVLD
ncbi:hypothetical protein ACHAXA_001102 [Cyclostephanos tholiformis]|uniref:Tr-type G domain-containing protein n=1 Tax=Cyclostephanos tholiformis TaxID=382380 RepID=A0ABD3RDT3_9STRA